MTEIAAGHQQAALQRSSLYQCLAGMLTYPSESFLEACRTGAQDRALLQLLEALPYRLSWPADTCSGEPVLAKLPSEYMRLFELPIEGQPCPLYGGVYSSSRRDVMEELLRYYRFFGLSISGAENGDLPDSIPTLLEFLQFLTGKEASTEAQDQLLSVRLTQKDLLTRHLLQWLPAIQSRMAERRPVRFYTNTLRLLGEFITAESVHLGQ